MIVRKALWRARHVFAFLSFYPYDDTERFLCMLIAWFQINSHSLNAVDTTEAWCCRSVYTILLSRISNEIEFIVMLWIVIKKSNVMGAWSVKVKKLPPNYSRLKYRTFTSKWRSYKIRCFKIRCNKMQYSFAFPLKYGPSGWQRIKYRLINSLCDVFALTNELDNIGEEKHQIYIKR